MSSRTDPVPEVARVRGLRSRSAEARHALLLGLLIAVASALRTVGLNGGLWFDEILSLVRSFRLPASDIFSTFEWDFHHPLYSLMAHASLTVFGESAWSIRLPAAVFGIATVPCLYAFARLVTDRREALLGAAFLTVSYHHVWFSQNARGYSALAFWAVLATWLLVKGLRTGRLRYWLAYGLAGGLGAYTHLTMGFLLGGHALVLAWAYIRSRKEIGAASRWKPVVGLVAAGSLSLALYWPIAGQVVDFFLHKPSHLRGVSTPLWALGETVRSFNRGLGLGSLAGISFALVLFALGMGSYWRRDRFVFWLYTAPGIATLVGALAARGTMYPRFFFFLIGFGVLVLVRGATVAGGLIARGAASLSVKRWEPRAWSTAVALLLILASSASLYRNYRLPKQDYAGALTFLDSQRAPNDRVLTVGTGARPFRWYYERPFPEIEGLPQLAAERRPGVRVWVLYTFPRYVERTLPEVMRAIRKDCEGVRLFHGTVGGGDITVCSFPPLAVDPDNPGESGV